MAKSFLGSIKKSMNGHNAAAHARAHAALNKKNGTTYKDITGISPLSFQSNPKKPNSSNKNNGFTF